METMRKIRVSYRNGESIRQISRDFNVARNTVKKIIRSEAVLAPVYARKVQAYPALGEHVTQLEVLLEASCEEKRKRSGKSFYESLCSVGYTGSYSAVGRYVKQWREQRSSAAPTHAYVPLMFRPGEAYQFDWSEESIILSGVACKIKVAHFILCYSSKKFIYAYPNETQEMVFDAHIRAFAFFGGVSERGIYDNMKTAVSKVLRGSEREFNPAFERLCAHYRMTPVACTPASGWEKGQIERQVFIDRAQFFTPMPAIATLAELNDRLTSQLITYNATHKHSSHKGKTIDEMFERERGCLAQVTIPFEGCKERDVKVTSTCLVMIDRNSYSVACAVAGKLIQCRLYADRLVCVYRGAVVAEHVRRFTVGHTYYQYTHYLPLLARKPGALRNGAPFIEMDLPVVLEQVRSHLEAHAGGTREVAPIVQTV